jgi:NAD(P) transhydrogenase subunit alpha
MVRRLLVLLLVPLVLGGALALAAPHAAAPSAIATPPPAEPVGQAAASGVGHGGEALDYWSMLTVFVLATFIGIGVIRRVSRLLHTPLMSITNAISAIAVVGSIIVTGGREYPTGIRIMGAIALFASMTNIVSGFLITERMLKMFKTERKPGPEARS